MNELQRYKIIESYFKNGKELVKNLNIGKTAVYDTVQKLRKGETIHRKTGSGRKKYIKTIAAQNKIRARYRRRSN